MSAAIRILRRVPLGRRLTLPLIIFGLAVLALAVTGWRMVDLVAENRTAQEEVRRDAETATRAAGAALRLHSLVHDHINRPTADVEPVLAQQAALAEAIEAIPADSPETEALTEDFAAAANAFMGHFQALRAVDKEIASTYATVTRRTNEMLGLFDILTRGGGGAGRQGALTGALQKANESFIKGMVALNEFYLSRDADQAAAAALGFGRIAETLPVITALAETDMQASALEALAARADALVNGIETLAGQFARRSALVNDELAAAQREMERLADALADRGEARRQVLTADLEEDARRMLTIAGVVALVVLILGVTANALLAASIRSPILRLNAVMQDLAGGNWSRDVDGTEARDEVGAMARTLDVFKATALRAQRLEQEKREALAAEKAETDRALERLDAAHAEITALNARLSSENLRLATELDVGKRLQTMLLPRPEELAGLHGLDVAATMMPADEVGGDYYDILRKDDRVRIGIGDVTGHGLESGVVMLMTQSVMRTLTVEPEQDLTTLMTVLNRTLFDNIRRMGSDRNLTFAVIDYMPSAEGGVMQIVGQHESLLIARADGSMEEIDTLMLGLPVGLVDDLRQYLGQTTVHLRPGDVVVLYTDGITEAADTDDRLFGLDRLKEVVQAQREQTPDTIKQAVLDAVTAHIGDGPVHDDLTLVVLKQGAPQALPEVTSGDVG